ncbi:MAG TPA: cell wall hydrolase [Alphaproteobacteria bacterium]
MSPGPELEDLSDLEVVARTVWGEARGEGPDGWAAVAWVIKNRAAHPGWWGHDLRSVCLKPAQFSSWTEGDPNRAKMLALPLDDPLLARIRAVVSDVLGGAVADPTGGALYYHTKSVQPTWDAAMTKTASIGAHEFFKEA